MAPSTNAAAPSTIWADAPFPLITKTHADDLPSSVARDHACIYWARQMSLIHNTMIRALNASYNQCLSIHPGTQEATDFLLFNLTFFEMLDHHHKVEEEHMFPQIEEMLGEPGAMEKNVEQHQAFEEGLGLFEKYVKGTKSEEYNGRTFRHIIDSFGSVLVQHLHDEIPSLLSLHTLDSAQMMKIWKKAEHAATADADPYTNWPFTFSCQDRSFLLDGEVRSFPPAPFFAPCLISGWFSRRFSGSWKFAPCDFAKRRRALAYAS